MAVCLENEIRVVKSVEGTSFYDASLPIALRNAQKFAGKNGYVASLPQLIHGRIVAPADNEVWKNWYSGNSEEDVGKTSQGNRVVLVVHGGGVLSSDRIEQAFKEGLTPQYAAKLTDKEFKSMLKGKVPKQKEFPVFSFDDFKNQVSLPVRYAVVLDFDTAKRTESGYQNSSALEGNPLFVARVGSAEQAQAYVKRAREVYKTDKLGNWHSFNSIYAEQTQGRLLFLGNDSDGGVGGGYYLLLSIGRFVGVAPEALVAREKIDSMPKAEQVFSAVQKYAADINKADLEKAVRNLFKRQIFR